MKSKFVICTMIALAICGCAKEKIRVFKPAGQQEPAATEQIVVETSVEGKESLPANPIINVYVENSGSMDGYVKGVTEFEQAVYNYLSDIKISNLAESLNLNYINSKIIPQNSDISDFIEKLEPTSFKAKGGDRSTSDISNVLKTVLSKTNDSIVSILISDCVFSPGSKVDANQYLVNQQIGIKVSMAEYLKTHPQTAVLIYQLSSQFDGKYYNRLNQPTPIKAQRPFYIWVIGHEDFIRQLITRVPETSFKGSGVQHSCIISAGNVDIKYDVPIGYGTFKYDGKSSAPTHNLVNMQKDKHTGKVMFSINADFSPLLISNDYIESSANYSINDVDYHLTNILPSHLEGYTHTLQFQADILKSTNLAISLNKSLPAWVAAMTSEDDIDIRKNNNMSQTYGLKYLVEGVNESFTNLSKDYTTLKINIK